MDLYKAIRIGAALVLGLVSGPILANDEQSCALWQVTTMQEVPKVDAVMAIVEAAYHRIGVGGKLVRMPPSRALIASSSGEADAELIRVAPVATWHPTLLRLAPQIASADVRVFARRETEFMPANLKEIPAARTGYPIGYVILERQLKPGGGTAVAHAKSLINMLGAGRFDYAIGAMGMLNQFLEDYPNIQRSPSPLVQLKLYHFIHERHRDKYEALLQALAEEIRLAGGPVPLSL